MFAGEARALPPDADGDGWDTTTSTPVDCDDTNPAVNPAASEDGLDEVDDDCDGSVLIHRVYGSSMNSLVTNDFTLGSGATQITTGPEGVVRFIPGATATMTGTYGLPFPTGRFTVVLRVAAKTGSPSCSLTVASTSMAASTRTFNTVGTHSFSFPGVLPGDTVGTYTIACTSGFGALTIDWLTVQNGPYVWAPLNDIGSAAETMGLPGMGRQSVVRASHGAAGTLGALAFVGSDVGGMAWSSDSLTWTTANGRVGEWTNGGQYGVWEVWALDESSLADQDVVVLTGDKDTAERGGLWYTEHLDAPDQSWVLVDDSIGASKHFDDCASFGTTKPLGSGQLIVNHPDDTAGNVFLLASQAPASRGLWFWDKSTTTAPAAPYFAASLPDGLPSALAFDSSGEWLLVGYRPLVGVGVEGGALYVCPRDFDAASGTDECQLVASDSDTTWSGDVRDIEADPTTAGRFFVADGGRRPDGSADGCTAEESTVFVVDVSGSWPSPTAMIADTDDPTPDMVPDWAAVSGATAYYDSEGCFNNDDGTDVYGELVPPDGSAGEEHEVVSVAVDPSGEWLFAFYRQGDSKRSYGCVRTFRAAIDHVETEATPWMPLQGWELGHMNFHPDGGGEDTHAYPRRGSVLVTGASGPFNSFQVAEPLLEVWGATGTHDAAFVYREGESPDLLVGGNFLWTLPSLTTSGAVGWDTPWPVDGVGDPDPTSDVLDELQIELAWDGESPVFQDSTAESLAVCPGCAQYGAGVLDLVLAAGVGDYKMARLYGQPASTPRPAADRSCEAHMLTPAGKDVSIWKGDSAHPAQAWMSLVSQDSDTDSGRDRGLLYLADVTTDAWCWDGVEAGGIAVDNFLKDVWTGGAVGADNRWELHCEDGGEIAEDAGTPASYWDACDQNGAAADPPWNLGASGVGHVVALTALGDATAVLGATPGAEPPPSTVTSGEGLWLATFDAVDGIAYDHVDLSPASVDFPNGACTEADFFEWSGQNAVALDPSSSPTGVVDLVVTSRSCGVAEVTFDATAGPPLSGAWSALDLGSDCSIADNLIRGASFSRDGRWLLVYGGPSGGVCALDRWDATADFVEVIHPTELDIQIQSVLPHPHVDDAFFVGGFWANGAADAPGVYLLQRRYRPTDGTWGWGSRRLSGDDLEHGTVADLDWGTGVSPITSAMQHLYVTTLGGGFWDLAVSRE